MHQNEPYNVKNNNISVTWSILLENKYVQYVNLAYNASVGVFVLPPPLPVCLWLWCTCSLIDKWKCVLSLR